MLQITDLNVSYGKKQVLKNINLSIKAHTVTAVIGKNGSGKSTLVSAINGQIPYTGSIHFAGQDICLLPSREKAKLISVLPQVLASPHITVEQLVKMGRNPYVDLARRFAPNDVQAVREAIETMGIQPLADRYVDRISGGERQKAYLAMTLAQKTRMMIFDEPGTYMDIAHERQFMETLSSLQRTMHKTVVIVMHNLATAIKYADRLVVLDEGQVVFDGTREECLDQCVVEQVFGVKKHLSDGEIFFS